MGNAPKLRRVLGAAAFTALCVVLMFLAILPLDHTPGDLPGPDILLACALVWTIRRPDLAPAPLIAAIFLLADFLLTRPPGLGAAAVLMATEYLRRHDALTTEVSFVLEWSVAGSMIASVIVGTSAVMALLGAQAPGVGPLMVKLVATILAYPLVVVFARLVFGIRRPSKSGGMSFGGAR